MVTQQATRNTRPAALTHPPVVEPVAAAEILLRRFAARAISALSNPRTLEDGRTLPPRLSANDCYVALEEACRKMARVAMRKFEGDSGLWAGGFETALDAMFPDPVAYLCRSIRSVVSDAERLTRRELPTVSLDQPLTADKAICLGDTLADDDEQGKPEEALIDGDERLEFRRALATALKSIPANYLRALERDIARDRAREDGARVAPETDRERQTVCRARAALAQIIKRECGADNPFVQLLAQQRNSRVAHKQMPSKDWSKQRQNDLFRRLLSTSWKERAERAAHPEDDLDEAVVNDVTAVRSVAPPSPEMRETMRVMDCYMLGDEPCAAKPEAQALYLQAVTLRKAGKIEQAIKLYRQAYVSDPRFYPALNEVGVLLIQSGNLRDALKAFVAIIEQDHSGPDRYIAATNAADIYLTWFDAGRNRERNIERAAYYARMAMERPTPMRACNLLLAYVKDRYYREAQELMDQLLRADLPECKAERFLQTLFQIRDPDLVAWWSWLDGELGKDGVA